MGLVVQAPGDALLALIAGPSVEGAATAAPADGGLFATLMASMFPTGTTEGGEGEGDSAAPGLPLPPAPEQETKTSNDAALALLTATAIIQFVPQPAQPTRPAPAVEQPAGAVERLASVAPAPQTEVGEATGDVVAPGASAGTELTEDSAVAPAPQSVLELHAEAISTVEGATATVQAEVPEVPIAIRSESPAEPAAVAIPTEAPAEPGVVRSVGNADNANRSQSGEQNASSGERGEPRAARRIENTPRASAKGIEHAAANSPVGELRTSDTAPLAEVAAPEATTSVEVPQQVEQVASTVFESVEVGATDARLRLDPAEMGEVVIHIQSDGDGGIRVEIRAERPEAAQLLRDHTQDLSQLLGDRGLNLSDVNVGLGRGNNEQGGFAEERNNNQPANGEFASILGLDEPASAARHNRLRSAYNPDGAHSYRV